MKVEVDFLLLLKKKQGSNGLRGQTNNTHDCNHYLVGD